MDVVEAVETRRSVKEFTERPVPREALERLLDLAVLAPNHRMTEPWGFVVLGPASRRRYAELKADERAGRIEEEDAAEAVRGRTIRRLGEVPAVIAFTQRLDDDPEVREEDFASVYMAMQNVLLGARAVGLGSHVKTGGLLDSPELRRALGVDEGERIVALVHLGEPREEPPARPRAPASEHTRWLP